MDVEADPVAGAVHEASAQPASAITSRHTRSTSAHGDPGPDRRHAGGLAGQHHVDRPAQLGRRRCRPTQTVRVMSEQYPSKRAPKSSTTGSPGRITRGPGRWWGLAALGPLATMVSNDGPLAPSRRISKSRARPKASSVRPDASCGPDALEGVVGDAGRFGQAGQLAGVLDPPQAFDQPDGRHQLDAREPVGRRRTAAGPR